MGFKFILISFSGLFCIFFFVLGGVEVVFFILRFGRVDGGGGVRWSLIFLLGGRGFK